MIVDPRPGLEDWARRKAQLMADEYALNLAIPRRRKNHQRPPKGLTWAKLCDADGADAAAFFTAAASRNKLLSGSLQETAAEAFRARLRELARQAA